MKTAKAKQIAVRMMASCAAAASFLVSVPAMAAENNSNVKPVEISSHSRNGYFSGLEMVMNKNEETVIQAPASVKTGMVETEDGIRHYDAFGQMTTGLHEEDGEIRLFDEDGKMLTGLQKIDEETYLFSKEDGTLQKGETKLDDKTYYLQEDGRLLQGWQEKDGKKSYYKEDGSLTKDTVSEIDGKRYSFDKDGVMEVNVSKDGYNYGADGVGVKKPEPKPAPAAAKAAAAAPVANAGSYQAIANAALAQLGRYQDCTMLVTNSLRAVGINFHGWPLEYLSLGPTTSNPVPGDIIVYHGHVAIYIGNGQAVHGGWLGNQTVISTVACDRQFVAYVHPILP